MLEIQTVIDGRDADVDPTTRRSLFTLHLSDMLERLLEERGHIYGGRFYLILRWRSGDDDAIVDRIHHNVQRKERSLIVKRLQEMSQMDHDPAASAAIILLNAAAEIDAGGY